jgi:hypothetical protein
MREHPATFPLAVTAAAALVGLCARLGGTAAAAAATVVGAMSANFFLRRPYLELRFDATDGVVAVLLLCVGAVVAATSGRDRISAAENRAVAPESARVARFVALVREGTDAGDLVLAVAAELMTLLRLRSCAYEPGAHTGSLPRLQRDGSIQHPGAARDDGDELAGGLVELPVRFGGQLLGRVVVEPFGHVAVPHDARVVAVLLTDHLAAAIAPRDEPVD